MSGLRFHVADRVTGRECHLVWASSDTRAAESRLRDLGFVIGSAQSWPGFRADPDLRASKVRTIRRYQSLRQAGNESPELLKSLNHWIPPEEQASLLAMEAEPKSQAVRDQLQTFGTLFKATRIPGPIDPATGMERRARTPEEEADDDRMNALRTTSLGQPAGTVFRVVEGMLGWFPKGVSIADLLQQIEVECYPNQRYWLLAEIVARLARRRKRDPHCGLEAERFAWQLVFEFAAALPDVQKHPIKYNTFNPIIPITTLATLLRESGWVDRSSEVRLWKHHYDAP